VKKSCIELVEINGNQILPFQKYNIKTSVYKSFCPAAAESFCKKMKFVFRFIVVIAVFLLSSCLHYREEWNLEKNGSGTVRITCEPSPNWQNYTKISNWQMASALFLPL